MAPGSPAWRSSNGRSIPALRGTTSTPASRSRMGWLRALTAACAPLGDGCIACRAWEECLRDEVFYSLTGARQKLALWRDATNSNRPHSSPGNKFPAEPRRRVRDLRASHPARVPNQKPTTINKAYPRYDRPTAGGRSSAFPVARLRTGGCLVQAAQKRCEALDATRWLRAMIKALSATRQRRRCPSSGRHAPCRDDHATSPRRRSAAVRPNPRQRVCGGRVIRCPRR